MRLGSFLLPAANRLRVSANGRRLDVRIVRRRRAWTSSVAQPVRNDTSVKGAERLAVARAGSADIFILRSGAPAVEPAIEDAAVDRDPDSILPPLSDALQLIGNTRHGTYGGSSAWSARFFPFATAPG